MPAVTLFSVEQLITQFSIKSGRQTESARHSAKYPGSKAKTCWLQTSATHPRRDATPPHSVTRYWARYHPQTQCKWTPADRSRQPAISAEPASSCTQPPCARPATTRSALPAGSSQLVRAPRVRQHPAGGGNSENSGLRHPRREGGSITHQPAGKPRLASEVASAIRPTGEYCILIGFPSNRGGSCLLDVHRRLLGQVLKVATPGHEVVTYHLCKNNYSFDALQAYCFGINIKL